MIEVINVNLNEKKSYLESKKTVGNLERESYTHTLRTSENTRLETQDKTKSGFSLFGKSGV